MKEKRYDIKRGYDFGKGEGPYERYDGRHTHPERDRRGKSKLQNLVSDTRGHDPKDILDIEVDQRNLEARTDDELKDNLEEGNKKYIRKIL